MIYYANNDTFKRLSLISGEELNHASEKLYSQSSFIESVKSSETNSFTYEWYIELFDYNKEKYLRAVHLSSLFTLYFDNITSDFAPCIGHKIKMSLLDYFNSNPMLMECIKKLYRNSFLNFYSRIDRSMYHEPFKQITNQRKSDSDLIKLHTYNNKIDIDSLNKAVNTALRDCGVANETKFTDILKKINTSYSIV